MNNIVDELLSMLIWIGDRARKVTFEVGMGTNGFARIVDMSCQLMERAACSSPNLEQLVLFLSVPRCHPRG